MPERLGGFERRDIDEGMRALASAGSPEEISRLIDSMPVLRSAIFHAQLRQYQLAMTSEFRKNPAALQGFLSRHDAFFTQIHALANFAQSGSEPEPRQSGRFEERPIGSSYFAALRQALGEAVPPPDGVCYAPGAAGIGEEIAKVTGKHVVLPAFEPVPGTLWSAVVAACGRCRELRVAIHPYLVDLLARPGLLETLKLGALELPCCPRCSAGTLLPLRIWISEQPMPHDPLAAVCTLVRVRETETIYRPPPGTVRKPEDDRILEIRLDIMMRQLGMEQATGEIVLTNGIAYSLEELMWRIEQTSANAHQGYQDVMTGLYQKLLSGMLSWQDAEDLVRKTVPAVGRDWPIQPAQAVGDLIKALVMNLVAEACAEVQDKPLPVRVGLAGMIADCYTGLGEIERARIYLARARDLASQGDMASSMMRALDSTDADILRAAGRYEEAEKLRPSGSEAEHSSSLMRARSLQNKGLDQRRAGRLREAVETLRNGLSILGGLTTSGGEPAFEIGHTRSGTLANLAFVYLDCAENLEVLEALAVKPMRAASLSERARARLQRIGSPEALLHMQREMTGPLRALLDWELDGEATAARLRARAAELLREAVSEARRIGDYEYLCIQCRALADLLLEAGDLKAAEDAARDCLQYAAQIREHRYLAAGSWLLGAACRRRGDLPAALKALAVCMQESVRQAVRSSAPVGPGIEAIAAEALEVGDMGADRLTAILIAESAKAVATGVSLIRAVPLQGRGPEPLRKLYQEREDLLLGSIWEADASMEERIGAVQSAIEAARRDLSLRDPRAANWHDATYLDISRPGPFRRLLAECGPNTTYIGFTIHQNDLFVYAVWRERQILTRRPVPDTRDPEQLGQALLAPLAERLATLQPEDRLIVSPCPELAAVPFALVEFGGRPLCQSATISVVNGSAMFEACAARPELELRSALAIGGPARPDAEELPHAVQEAEQLAVRLEAAGVQVRPVLSGAAATVPALQARAGKVQLLHFACHASAPGDKEQACLMLAPAPLARDSGLLFEDRVVNELTLQPGCHVNLAACRSSVSGGAGTYFSRGLVTAFLVAGASSVLAALWPLADAPAAIFQAAYYERLAGGLAPAEALAATQRAAIGGELGNELRRPEHFGGYLLHGLTKGKGNRLGVRL